MNNALNAGACLSTYAQLARIYLEIGEAHDIPVSYLLEGTNLSSAELADPELAINVETLGGIAQRASTFKKLPAVGIEVGLRTSLRTFGFLGYAAMSSKTVGEALQLFQSFQGAFTVLESTVVREGEWTAIRVEERSPLGELFVASVDSTIVGIHKMAVELVGETGPLEVWLSYSEAPYHSMLREIIPGPIRFGCGTNQYRFKTQLLDRGVGTTDPTLAELSIAQCRRELKRVSEKRCLVNQVRATIMEHLPDRATRERVAKALGMSGKTLQRRLESESTGFMEVVEETQKALAIDMLVATEASIDSIAASLGYSDEANFRRAFRRWMSVSPGTYRRRSQCHA